MSRATAPGAFTVRRPVAGSGTGAAEELLSRAFVWSLGATAALISAEAAIPLSPSDRTLYSASSLPLAGLLVTAVALVLTGRARRVIPPMVAPWVAVLSVAALSMAWSIAPSETADAAPILASVVAMLLAVTVVDPPVGLLAVLERSVVWGGAVGAFWGLVNFLAGTLPEVGPAGTPRFTAVDAPNATAAAMLLPFVLALHSALRSRRERTGRGDGLAARRGLVDAALAALLLCGMLLTGSRGALVAVFVAALVVLIGGRFRIRPRLVAGFVAVLLATFLLAPPALQGHLTATHSTGRTGLWALGIEACERHCVVGSGYGTFPTVYGETFLTSPDASGHRSREFTAHNIWIQAAVETGLLGVVVLLVAVATTARHAWRAPPDTRVAATASLAAVVVATMFLSHLPFRYFWLVLVYVAVSGPRAPTERPASVST